MKVCNKVKNDKNISGTRKERTYTCIRYKYFISLYLEINFFLSDLIW